MTFKPTQGQVWLFENSRSHACSKDRRYTQSVLTTKLVKSDRGDLIDPPPFTGTVVHRCPDFYVVQTDRSAFKIIDPGVLREPLPPNGLVRITPYQRRHFNGLPIAPPANSVLPVPPPRTPGAAVLLDLLHHGRCDDGVRSIANLLVDCNAYNVKLQEDEDKGLSTVSVDVETLHLSGRVLITHDVDHGLLTVEVRKRDRDGILQAHALCQGVTPKNTPRVLTDLLCDGQWKFAQVSIVHERKSDHKHSHQCMEVV